MDLAFVTLHLGGDKNSGGECWVGVVCKWCYVKTLT